MIDKTIVKIDYTNHRGERAWRKIHPFGLRFAKNEWHKEEQWLLHAFDEEKKEFREFAMKDIHEWKLIDE